MMSNGMAFEGRWCNRMTLGGSESSCSQNFQVPRNAAYATDQVGVCTKGRSHANSVHSTTNFSVIAKDDHL